MQTPQDLLGTLRLVAEDFLGGKSLQLADIYWKFSQQGMPWPGIEWVGKVVPVVAGTLFFTRSELEGKEYFRGSEACFELSRTAGALRRSYDLEFLSLWPFWKVSCIMVELHATIACQLMWCVLIQCNQCNANIKWFDLISRYRDVITFMTCDRNYRSVPLTSGWQDLAGEDLGSIENMDR